MSSPRLLSIHALVTSSSTLAMGLVDKTAVGIIIVLAKLFFYTGKTFVADTNGIRWRCPLFRVGVSQTPVRRSKTRA